MIGIMELLPTLARHALQNHGVTDSRLATMSDREIMQVPFIGKKALQIIREITNGIAPKPPRNAADRLWLAGMIMQGMTIRGHGNGKDAVRSADALMEALDV
jgi:hypothetical protein